MRRILLAIACLLGLLSSHDAGAVAGIGPVLIAPSAAVVYTPPAGMTLWLEGSKGVTLGGSGSWVDQSTNARIFDIAGTTTNITTTTLLGRPAVAWSVAGTDSYFDSGATTGASFITATAWTFAACWEYTASSAVTSYAGAPVLQGSAGDWGLQVAYSSGNAQAVALNYPQSAVATGVGTGPHCSIALLLSGMLYAIIDGGAPVPVVSVASAPLTETVNIGANTVHSNGFQGSIGEVLVYASASSGLTSSLNTYFANKWGL